MTALVAELCREKRPDVLQIEYTHLAPLRHSAPEVPAILVEHDVTFTLYEQVARLCQTRAARQEYRRWLRFERQWLRQYDAVWTVSDQDFTAAVSEGSRAETTFVIPNGVDTERFAPGEQAVWGPEILYVGSFRHFPNVVAFERLCNEIMPRVWQTHGNARLRVIAGTEPEKYWSRFMGRRSFGHLDSRIRIHGFVEDLRPFYRKACVVVAPLAISAGTNIKVLEAMACGKALVATSVGCKGLNLTDGHDIIVRDDWTEFAQSVSDLLTNESLGRILGTRARRTAASRFSWRKIADDAYASYEIVARASDLVRVPGTRTSLARGAALQCDRSADVRVG